MRQVGSPAANGLSCLSFWIIVRCLSGDGSCGLAIEMRTTLTNSDRDAQKKHFHLLFHMDVIVSWLVRLPPTNFVGMALDGAFWPRIDSTMSRMPSGKSVAEQPTFTLAMHISSSSRTRSAVLFLELLP
jgi:hypothetical protein